MECEKKVLITGASGGIGRAVALSAASAGFGVVVHCNRAKERAEEAADMIAAAGGCAEVLQFDIADRQDCAEKLNAWVEKNGAPWGVVCCAGICRDNVFPALSADDWDSVLRVNLDGFYNVLNPLVMPMCRRRRGRIITISSVSGIMGNYGQVNYSAAKAGIIGATKALAAELAGRSITVNCIAPGFIDTDMTASVPAADAILRQIPMRRAGKPEEVAAAAVFLLSDAASYITRQVISVNGGLI
ncbi:MAG: 3-oxoacyl-ACP reductase FabG [Bacteroides sp.]|nr:3-oxoacyl-ACP reductase FabG [Prevotella sp.]MCM1408024.1 3-oxoacyl-ACP reductase FabG [Treponema brennaborense]MCM1469000.1 3-oxoacyl-ACP reductase FabG [Bacteroides sp.]